MVARASWELVPGSDGRDVQFTDDTAVEINVVKWLWDFGDGYTSDERDPVHRYPGYSNYTCTFTVWDSTGRPSETELDVETARMVPSDVNPLSLLPLLIVAFGALATAFGRNPLTRIAGASVMILGLLAMAMVPPDLGAVSEVDDPVVLYVAPLVAATLLFAGLAMVSNLYVRITLIVSIGISGLLVYMWW